MDDSQNSDNLTALAEVRLARASQEARMMAEKALYGIVGQQDTFAGQGAPDRAAEQKRNLKLTALQYAFQDGGSPSDIIARAQNIYNWLNEE